MPLVDLEQLRAGRAFAAAMAVTGQQARETFLQEARKLPVTLQTNGLLAGLAFLKAKSQAPALVQGLEGHLEQQQAAGFAKVRRLFTSGTAGDDPLTAVELQRLTAEAIVFAGWLKRAAEAVCAGSPDASKKQPETGGTGSTGADPDQTAPPAGAEGAAP